MIARAREESEPVARFRQLARQEARQGNFRVAKKALGRCVKHNRQDARAWELYGTIHYRSGNFPLAAAAYERAAEIRPLQTASQIYQGITLARLGRWQEAANLLKSVLQHERLEADQLLQLAMGLDAVNQTHLALHACRLALRDDVDCAQAYFDLGYYCNRVGYPQRTVESLMRKALRCDPRNARFQIGLACLLTKQHRLQEAHQIVRDLGMTSISAMTCLWSVEQLIAVYREAADDRRLVVCHQRLVELRLRGCGFEDA